MEERFRKTPTPAGFVPKPFKTGANKSAKRYLRNALKKLYPAAKTLGIGALEEPFRKTRTPAGFVPKPFKTGAKKVPNVRHVLSEASSRIFTDISHMDWFSAMDQKCEKFMTKCHGIKSFAHSRKEGRARWSQSSHVDQLGEGMITLLLVSSFPQPASLNQSLSMYLHLRNRTLSLFHKKRIKSFPCSRKVAWVCWTGFFVL